MRSRPLERLLRSRATRLLGGVVAAVVALAACEGDNLFPTQPGGEGEPRPPSVQIVSPGAGTAIVAGDSLRLRIAAVDSTNGLDSLVVQLSGAVNEVFRTRLSGKAALSELRLALPLSASGPLAVVATVRPRGGAVTVSDTLRLSVADTTAPTVVFLRPASPQRVALGDSVYVQVSAADNHALASVELGGYALRGSAALGTQVRVERFARKLVVFEGGSKSATVERYLLPAADTLAESPVFLEAVVRDASGNRATQTFQVSIGGPRVAIREPAAGGLVTAGTQVRVRVSANVANDRVASLVLRSRGALERADTLVTTLQSAVDTAFTLSLPLLPAADSLHLSVTGYTALGDSATSTTVSLRVLPATGDRVLPQIRFASSLRARVDLTDTLVVTLSATDNTRVRHVGATVQVSYRGVTPTESVALLADSLEAAAGTLRFPLPELTSEELRSRLLAQDTATLSVEVTAFAVDTAGNCAAAVTPGAPQSLPCRTAENGGRIAGVSGARSEVLLTRGQTIRKTHPADVLVDLVSDGSRVFVSNYSRNRLDVLQVGGATFESTVLVGSQPWGLALSPARDELYVANSGGTNLSVVDLFSAREARRIQTPNQKVYDVAWSVQEVTDTVLVGDSLVERKRQERVPSTVTRHDFSDRPQFVGVSQNQNVFYSTRPTAAATPGTIRVYRSAEDRLEIVTDYLEKRVANKLLILNADSAFLVLSQPYNLLMVCPRPRSRDPELDRELPQVCVTGTIDSVQVELEDAGYDTEFRFGLDIAELGLTDTTFVAVSGDHSTIAFGEGAKDNARVVVFADPDGTLVKAGEIVDIVGNTAERVIGLGLNFDGSLGVARGREAYFFTPDLRLQGVVQTGAPSGGVALHPDQFAYPTEIARYGFISGSEAVGGPYVDIVDTYNFCQIRRVFVREPITGAIRAVLPAEDDPPDLALRVYALTASGVSELVLTHDDLLGPCR